MISQKEKLVFGIINLILAAILIVCFIVNIVTGSWGLAIFVIMAAGLDIFNAVNSLRYWFRYKEATKGSRAKLGIYDEVFEDVFDEDINGDDETFEI